MTHHPSEDLIDKAVELGLVQLSRRDQTKHQLREKLGQKGFDGPVIDSAIGRLEEMGYVDDQMYAKRFTQDRRQIDSWGDVRIAKRLREVGIDRETITAALESDSREEQIERAVELLKRRLDSSPQTNAEYNRAAGLLMRKGYSSEMAADAIRLMRSAD